MKPVELGRFVREEVPKAMEAAHRHAPSVKSLGARALLDALDCAMELLREAAMKLDAYGCDCGAWKMRGDSHEMECPASTVATLRLVLGESREAT